MRYTRRRNLRCNAQKGGYQNDRIRPFDLISNSASWYSYSISAQYGSRSLLIFCLCSSWRFLPFFIHFLLFVLYPVFLCAFYKDAVITSTKGKCFETCSRVNGGGFSLVHESIELILASSIVAFVLYSEVPISVVIILRFDNLRLIKCGRIVRFVACTFVTTRGAIPLLAWSGHFVTFIMITDDVFSSNESRIVDCAGAYIVRLVGAVIADRRDLQRCAFDNDVAVRT